MITVFYKQEDRIASQLLTPHGSIPANALWYDVESPSPEEEATLTERLHIAIPTREEIWKNHVLNRMYTENAVSYMTAAVINKANSQYPQTSSVTFILSHDYLVTIRYISPTSFRSFTERFQRHPFDFSNGAEVLEGLLEEIITRVAHNSEIVVDELDGLSHRIFSSHDETQANRNSSEMMKDALKTLGMCADLNSKINESLHSINRLLSFFHTLSDNGKRVDHGIGILVTDVSALTQQTAFLSDKITFQLDATLGVINVEQNTIIKIFSVVAVFFLPPTMVSSVYGMNFHSMPELDWTFGYPLALLLMFLFAATPYVYFKKKGWL